MENRIHPPDRGSLIESAELSSSPDGRSVCSLRMRGVRSCRIVPSYPPNPSKSHCSISYRLGPGNCRPGVRISSCPPLDSPFGPPIRGVRSCWSKLESKMFRSPGLFESEVRGSLRDLNTQLNDF